MTARQKRLASIMQIINQLREEGQSIPEITRHLNEHNITTVMGHSFGEQNVSKYIRNYNQAQEAASHV